MKGYSENENYAMTNLKIKNVSNTSWTKTGRSFEPSVIYNIYFMDDTTKVKTIHV